jgi:hypothetical protein
MSSKKHRKSIRAQYEHNAKFNPADKRFMKQIKTLMNGRNKFCIFLTKKTQGKFVGAWAQAGHFDNKIEVMPDSDEIEFTGEKFGVINIKYTRIYSDFPPSVSNFPLSQVQKIEEILSEEIPSRFDNRVKQFMLDLGDW